MFDAERIRNDYRQRLAAGFKAHDGNSQHGGSNATGGLMATGRAIDTQALRAIQVAIWHWIDAHGAKFGLRRPMPNAVRRMSSAKTPSMTSLMSCERRA